MAWNKYMIGWLLFLLTVAGKTMGQYQVSASSKVSFIREWDAKAPIQDPSNLVQRPVADVSRTTQYVDGLGRPIQTVNWQANPLGNDLVTPILYDDFGREHQKYLPFVSNGSQNGNLINDGNFKLDPFQQQNVFMQGQYPGETFYYGQTDYEASSLNRELTTYAAGNAWVGSASGVHTQYLVNDITDNVQIWNITQTPGSLPVSAGSYPAGQLYKNVTTDEMNHSTVEYKDKNDHVILKKVQINDNPGPDHSDWLCTYYIYDDLDNLRFVIPPKAVQAIDGSWGVGQDIADGLCFRYEYDGRKRMVIRKVPGAAEAWMVYDARDRVVLTQDGNMRIQGKWLFNQYDQLDRPILKGFYSNAGYTTQATMQGYVNGQDLNSYTVAGSDILTKTYYDDYIGLAYYGEPGTLDNSYSGQFLLPDNTTYPYPQALAALPAPRGQKTGEWDATVPGPLYRYFYDDHGRLIQTKFFNVTTGTDVTTTQYDFSGKVLRTYVKTERAVSSPQTHYILTKMDYDAMGRLKHTYKNIDNAPSDQLINSIDYDELGQIKTKSLGNNLDNLSYEYNIRGWLTTINKDFLAGNTHNYFGAELGYTGNSTAITGFGLGNPQLSGNPNGTVWKSAGDNTLRRYVFQYDDANRLIGSDYNYDTKMSFTNFIGYDANGNIALMMNYGWKLGAPAGVIDYLVYSYPDNSNQLSGVVDDANDQNSTLGDFHYDPATKGSSDYTYDANGNLLSDKNKGITNIIYDWENLPTQIEFTNYRFINYVYDNFGIKRERISTDHNSDPAMRNLTLYMTGGIEIYNDTLSTIGTEEGRARWAYHKYTNGDSAYALEYDFFEKDHLGNTRVILTQEKDTAKYMATMEGAYRSTENALFYGIDPTTVVAKPTAQGYPNDLSITSPNDSVIRVNGNGPKVGPAIILKVMSGDQVDLAVQYFYQSQSGPGPSPLSPTDLLGSLAPGLFSLTGGTHGLVSDLTNPSTSPLFGALSSAINNQSGTGTTTPQAYLNWVLLDNQFNYVGGGQSGAMQVKAGGTQGGQLQTPLATGITLSQSGYLYIFVSNTTPGWDVFFDNLSVQHRSGPMIEENHYYPYGLSMAGISDKAIKGNYRENKYRFNGKELENKNFIDGSGLELYDFGQRMQDPQLGRWWKIDPMAGNDRRWSPYNYGLDNPIRFIDPDGMWTEDANSYSTTDANEIKDFLNSTNFFDQGQRRKAIEKAREYVAKKPQGDSYKNGSKGGPGEIVDCSGLVSGCILAAGLPDPNGDQNKHSGTGVQRIEQVTQKIQNEGDVVPGNLVTFYFPNGSWPTHIGIITNVYRDKDGKIIYFQMIDSHSGEGPSDDAERYVWPGKKEDNLGMHINGYYKWDDKPDTPMNAVQTATYNRLLQDADIAEKKGLNGAAADFRNAAKALKSN